MVSTFSQPKVEIVLVDNGYIVEWQDERNVSDEDPERFYKSRGVKIFENRGQLMGFLSSFFPPNTAGASVKKVRAAKSLRNRARDR